MVAKKTGSTATPRRRARKKVETADDIVRRHDLTTYYVPIDQLKPYPGNPNVGGAEEAIDDSLDTNGLYRAVLVQKSTNYILAGNHTWGELKKKGATEIACHLLDVDETEARRIVLADNNIGKLAHIDRMLEAEMITALPDAHGTGFKQEDMDQMERLVQDSMAEMDEMGGEDGILAQIHRESLGGIDAPDADADDDMGFDPEDGVGPTPEEDLKKASDVLPGMYDLKEDFIWDSKHPMGYPPLRPDMMVEKLPEPLDSWAGSATRDDPRGADVWWLYNYGIDSTSGMADKAKIILSFYCWDDYFDEWWFYPAKHTTKALNSGITMAVTPNFSMWIDNPMVISYYNLYRSRWVGRYLQEAGIRVIPDLQWGFGHPKALDIIDKHTSYGLPNPLPVASIQLQNGSDRMKDEEWAKTAKAELRHAVAKMGVQKLIVYSGKPGKELIDGVDLGCDVLWLPNRNMKLSAAKKKKTAASEEDGTL